MEKRFMVGTKAETRHPKWRALASCVLVALGMGLLGLLAPAWGAATTLTVDRQDDPAPATAVSCTEAPNDCSLRGAIVAANASAGAETVNVPAGTYTLTIAGPDEDASATGDLDASNVIIRGGGARRTKVVGGSVFDDRVFDLENATLSGLTITDGGTRDVRLGGGVSSEGDVTLDKLAITANTAEYGGGIHSSGGPGTTFTITNSTISGNTARSGGGGIARGRIGTAMVVNTTISGNHTRGNGGGVFLFGSSWLTLLNSTVASNSSPGIGGGIYGDRESSLLEAKNTIVSGNTQTNCHSRQAHGKGIISLGHNISSDRTCHFEKPPDKLDTRPLLGALSNNGGPTNTRALLEGSPAIDKGANIGCPAMDQRGRARPKDGNGDGGARCDIGAFEKQRP